MTMKIETASFLTPAAQPLASAPLLKRVAAVRRALRVHQWAKNALLFTPAIAGHRVAEPELLVDTVLAFGAFSLCASSVYVLNDLIDLESDRQHPTKKNRPFASGDLSPIVGLAMIPALLALAGAIAVLLPARFQLLLAGYFGVTLAYSTVLKRIELLDVITLAGLYTIRIFAGSLATGIPVSHWLASFSMFLFLSLALAKRYSELRLLAGAEKKSAAGRGYLVSDFAQISNLGVASGYVSVLVFALYIHSDKTAALYRTPELLWGIAPVMVYWISRIWLLADRDELHDDPVLHALRDKASYVVLAIAATLLALAV